MRVPGTWGATMKTIVGLTAILGLLATPAVAGSPGKGQPFPWNRVPGIRPEEVKEGLLREAETLLEGIACYGRCSETVAACLRKNPPHRTAARLSRDLLSFRE